MPSLQDAIAAIQLEREQLVARLGQLDAALAALTSVQGLDPAPPVRGAETAAQPVSLDGELPHRRLLTTAMVDDAAPAADHSWAEGRHTTGQRPYYHRRAKGDIALYDSTQLTMAWVCDHQGELLTFAMGAEATGMSTSVVGHALKFLEREGIVERVRGRDITQRFGRQHVYRTVEVSGDATEVPAGDGGPAEA